MPKRTYQPSQKKRMTTHGFLVRTPLKLVRVFYELAAAKDEQRLRSKKSR